MRKEREFSFPGEPYPRFASEATWSVIGVAVLGVFLLGYNLPLVVIATACATVAAGLGWMLYHRVAEARARHIRAVRPRMGALMARYGSVPRPQRTAGQGA